LFRLDTKTLIMQDTMRPKLLWNCIWIFPPFISRDFFSCAFSLLWMKKLW
jgi:hypothetical protein